MQSLAAIEDEVAQLRLRIPCAGVDIVRSSESWNPVAAVILRSVRLPAAIRPQVTDMRVSIPNLYGFAVSASIAVLPTQLLEQTDTGVRPVPFCVALSDEVLDAQGLYSVDVRENRAELASGYSICVSPTTLPDRFHHVPLPQIVGYMLDYLQSPTAAVQADLAEYYARLEAERPSTSLFMSIAHAHEGLGEYAEALKVLNYALECFPGVQWLGRKAEHIRSLI